MTEITTRKLKIQPKSISSKRQMNKVVPQILLIGNWLDQCGFKPRQMVDVDISEGMLVIKLSPVIILPPKKKRGKATPSPIIS